MLGSLKQEGKQMSKLRRLEYFDRAWGSCVNYICAYGLYEYTQLFVCVR